MCSHTRITDVAAAAGVSATTVSNVLNNPDRVETRTRNNVTEVIRRLNFSPNRNAVALRKGSKANGTLPSEPKLPPPPVPDDDQDTLDQGAAASEAQLPVWEGIRQGDTVYVVRLGRSEGTALVDAVMPDHSALWIWLDNGMGRTIVLPTDDIQLRVVQPICCTPSLPKDEADCREEIA